MVQAVPVPMKSGAELLSHPSCSHFGPFAMYPGCTELTFGSTIVPFSLVERLIHEQLAVVQENSVSHCEGCAKKEIWFVSLPYENQDL